MAKKAISPLIAIVIMIAVVITIGGMISSWLSGFVYDASTEDTCAINTIYTISDVSYNSTSGRIKLKVKNSGTVDLYNFTVEADNAFIFDLIKYMLHIRTFFNRIHTIVSFCHALETNNRNR